MKENTFNGDNGLANQIYFDCATIKEERGVVYNDLTPENLSKWFKDTNYKFPLQIMQQKDLRAWISREDGEAFLTIYRITSYAYPIEKEDKWTLHIGRTITKTRWNAITKFIEDYISGDLHKNYNTKSLQLA